MAYLVYARNLTLPSLNLSLALPRPGLAATKRQRIHGTGNDCIRYSVLAPAPNSRQLNVEKLTLYIVLEMLI